MVIAAGRFAAQEVREQGLLITRSSRARGVGPHRPVAGRGVNAWTFACPVGTWSTLGRPGGLRAGVEAAPRGSDRKSVVVDLRSERRFHG